MKKFIESMKGSLFGIILLVGYLLFFIFSDGEGGNTYSDYDEYKEQKNLELYEQEQSQMREAQEQLAEDHYRELEMEAEENKQLYFIDNGYYFHDDINCKGLEGYSKDELNYITWDGLWDHKELSPCNWCVKGNN